MGRAVRSHPSVKPSASNPDHPSIMPSPRVAARSRPVLRKYSMPPLPPLPSAKIASRSFVQQFFSHGGQACKSSSAICERSFSGVKWAAMYPDRKVAGCRILQGIVLLYAVSAARRLGTDLKLQRRPSWSDLDEKDSRLGNLATMQETLCSANIQYRTRPRSVQVFGHCQLRR